MLATTDLLERRIEEVWRTPWLPYRSGDAGSRHTSYDCMVVLELDSGKYIRLGARQIDEFDRDLKTLEKMEVLPERRGDIVGRRIKGALVNKPTGEVGLSLDNRMFVDVWLADGSVQLGLTSIPDLLTDEDLELADYWGQ